MTVKHQSRVASVSDTSPDSSLPLAVTEPVRLTWRTLGFGLAGAMVSALATAALLLINGSVTLICLNGFIPTGPEWLQRPSLMQFILFCVPLVLVVVQWMIWDVVVDRLRRPAS